MTSFHLFFLMYDCKEIKLVLENGDEFKGFSFGAEHSVSGEVVFSTGMVGYPESLTDPSYKGQILVLTYPLIGNYGVPSNERENGILKHFETDGIKITALVISDLSENHSHWNSAKSLSEWLKENNIPGLYGIDTRTLTKKLREKGVMLGKVVFEKDAKIEDPNKRNIVAEVSCKEKTVYNENGKKRIILVDCGAKNNIVRCLVKRNCTVIKVPWDYDFVEAEKYDGIMISNGPGDPKMCSETIAIIKKAM